MINWLHVVSRSSSGFILLSCSVDLLVQCHGERHTEELGGKQRLSKAEGQIGLVIAKVTHLYDQHTHGDCSQEVFVVIQPLLHLLIATLKMVTSHVSSSENLYLCCSEEFPAIKFETNTGM